MYWKTLSYPKWVTSEMDVCRLVKQPKDFRLEQFILIVIVVWVYSLKTITNISLISITYKKNDRIFSFHGNPVW